MTVDGGVACVPEGTGQETELGLQDGHRRMRHAERDGGQGTAVGYRPGLDFQFSWKMLFE